MASEDDLGRFASIYFAQSDLTTLRFSNDDVRENIEGVPETIQARLTSLPNPRWKRE